MLSARGGEVLPWQVEIKQAIERIEHLLVTNEFSDRVFDLRDSDPKTVQGQTTSYPRTVIPHSDFVRRLIAISPKN